MMNTRIKVKSFVFLLFVFLVSVFPVSAFELFEQSDKFSVSACGSFAIPLSVVNTNVFPVDVQVSAEGAEGLLVSFSPAVFVLNASDSGVVQEKVTVPCSSQEKYAADIISFVGEKKSVQKQLFVVSPAQNIEMFPHVFYRVVNACEPAEFLVEVRNPFAMQEEYVFSVPEFENEVVISPGSVVLDAFESRNVSITVALSDCTLTGRVPVVFRAAAKNTGQLFELGLTLDVNADGVPVIAPGMSRVRTNYSENAVRFPVYNTYADPIKVKVSIVGESWMNVSPSKFTVHGSNQSLVTVVFNPDVSVSAGYYNATIVLTDVESEKDFKKTFVVELSDISFSQKLVRRVAVIVVAVILLFVILLCGFLFVKKYNSPAAKHARLVSAELRRQRKESLQKSRETRKNSLIKIQSSLSSAVHVRSDVSVFNNNSNNSDNNNSNNSDNNIDLLRQHYFFVPKHLVVNLNKRSFSSLFCFVKFLFLTVFFVLGSWLLIYSTSVPFFVGGVCALVIVGIVILLKIRRIYVVSKKFSLVVAHENAVLSTFWRKGVSCVSLVLKLPVKNLCVQVKKCRSSAPKLCKQVYSYSTISANAGSDIVEQVQVTARIPVRWLVKRNVSVETVSNILVWRWSGSEWLEIVPEVKCRTSSFVEIQASGDSLGTYAFGICNNYSVSNGNYKKLSFKKIAQKHHGKGLFGYAVLALAFVLAIILFTYAAQNDKQEQSGIPRQVWFQDTDLILNLSHYFFDPDGDKLQFGAANLVENVKIDVLGDIAILSPDSGFVGSGDVVFVATDKNNSSVSSNSVKLIVQKSYLPVFFRKYFINIVIGLFILSVLFIIISWKETIKRFLEGN